MQIHRKTSCPRILLFSSMVWPNLGYPIESIKRQFQVLAVKMHYTYKRKTQLALTPSTCKLKIQTI